MKASRVNKVVSLMMATIFTLLLVSATAANAKETINVVSGTVVSIDTSAGKLAVLDKAGRTIKLQAQPDKNPQTLEQLKTLQEGDKITVEYDKKGVIQSISMQMSK